MDVKEIIAKVEEKLSDASFKKALKENPAKALEELLGVNLPDEQINAVMAAVKTKLGAGGISGIAKEAEEKLGGVLGGILGKK